ncbi:MAG: adenylate cyclase [Sulfitobacter sp.]|jgi:adenylate cyclase
MRFPLRIKFFLFATLLAVLPLAIVGQNLTTLTRDELKSAANEDLTAVASQLRRSFDSEFQGRWLSPLQVIRNGIDSPDLDVQQKVSLLTLGIQELPQVIALQLAIDGSKLPILAPDQGFAQRLDAAGLDPVKTLSTAPEMLEELRARGAYGTPLITRIPETGDWIATIALPLDTKIAGRDVTFAAKINLASLASLVANHPFAARGEISVIDREGNTVLAGAPRSLTDRALVRSAIPLITANARADTLQSYTRKDGMAMLGAYAFPNRFPWAVVTEQSEDTAYAVVNAITRQILIVGMFGFAIASIGAVIFARRLTKPILEIGSVAAKVGQGDFSARVKGVNSSDEIGDLSQRINQMIGELGERLELMKFVSHSTMTAIQSADQTGMMRGGQRRRVSVIFTDIRGYTEFSERVPPEVVIEALNQYFDVQTDIVEEHHGDVDKFIGDALVAVFEGDEMETRAVRCAVKITAAMQDLLQKYPDYNLHVGIGIASGEVVVGAMGARERMDFTVLGSTVNLSARLCSKADPGQVLLDQATRDASGDLDGVVFDRRDPIALKGYADLVANYAARGINT